MAREDLRGMLLEKYPRVFDSSATAYQVKLAMELLTLGLKDVNHI